ncbi:ABC transporter substrate-binding protein [Xylanimonas oleitrophica]|uniref:ABC transporter substrate-binding protein n=1 Tax=Xylanimonas oleitrophica TaxID=2607479 RepID=A0A2W5YIX2_9MICO|nr:ABC transporter substrate-binding protein [Xylanimonas oleitrophica]PZR55071.1 ABC transporter substrate-binding protein [Xylanimonas oleitrophica]
MKLRRYAGVTAMTVAGALALAACSGGSTGGDDGASGAGTAFVTVSGTEPQNPLVPTNTNEVGGGLVVTQIFSGLVYYGADGSHHNEIAESIESDDDQTWTITIADGWKFSDGSPVTANSFVDAWNYGILRQNAQTQSYFYSYIEGTDDDGLADGPASGLNVVDDHTFTVTLKSPDAEFPLRLGYSAYYPLPEAFFEDPDTLGEQPVSNGPYVVEEWNHNRQISLRPNPEYPADGPRAAQNDGVDYVIYDNEDTAYLDLQAGNLDIIQNVPASAMGTFEDDLGDRAVSIPAAIIQTMTVPEYLPEFQGDAGIKRRQAISHAIDREQITETIFNGSRIPAHDFTSPVVPGYSEKIPGSEVLDYDATRAKQLWDEAEAESPVGADYTLQIASNADSDHQTWVDAVCNNIRQVLEIGCEFYPYPTFAEFLNARTGQAVPGVFRAGWQADYPSMSNFLGPIYRTGAGSNHGFWSNPEFDQLLTEGGAAATPEESQEIYQRAQEILFAQLPGIPLWYNSTTAGYGEAVENVQFGWDSAPILYEVTKQG